MELQPFNHNTPRIISIPEITDGMKDWMIKVMVLQTTEQRISKDGKRKYKRYVFIDAQGTKIKGCALDKEIQLMDDCFTLFKTYELSSNTSRTQMNALPNYHPELELILNQKAIICPVESDPINVLTGKPQFVIISPVHAFLQSKDFIETYQSKSHSLMNWCKQKLKL